MKEIELLKELTPEQEAEAEAQLKLYWNYSKNNDLANAMTHLKAAANFDYSEVNTPLLVECTHGNVDWMTEEEVIRRLKQFADDGDSHSEVLLGLYYTYDKHDEIKGADFFHRSAFHGDAMGMYRLSEYYFSKGEIIAMEYLYKAAELGDESAIEEVAKLEEDLGIDGEDKE